MTASRVSRGGDDGGIMLGPSWTGDTSQDLHDFAATLEDDRQICGSGRTSRIPQTAGVGVVPPSPASSQRLEAQVEHQHRGGRESRSRPQQRQHADPDEEIFYTLRLVVGLSGDVCALPDALPASTKVKDVLADVAKLVHAMGFVRHPVPVSLCVLFHRETGAVLESEDLLLDTCDFQCGFCIRTLPEFSALCCGPQEFLWRELVKSANEEEKCRVIIFHMFDSNLNAVDQATAYSTRNTIFTYIFECLEPFLDLGWPQVRDRLCTLLQCLLESERVSLSTMLHRNSHQENFFSLLQRRFLPANTDGGLIADFLLTKVIGQCYYLSDIVERNPCAGGRATPPSPAFTHTFSSTNLAHAVDSCKMLLVR
ncbi:unnamed protein product [Amoebophrya sp. A120]|nr:unnamed protein product [Amoebophrya sp. A120]|eukprot:GSA120T00004391001.1